MRFLLLAFLLTGFTASAQAMTIEEAYQAIPHQRTAFDPGQAKMPPAEATYLESFFALTDAALRDRVEALTQLTGGEGGIDMSEYNSRHADIMKALDALSPPAAATQAHKLIVEAITEQAEFLNVWGQADAVKKESLRSQYRNDPLVLSSHAKLVQGYMLLMKAYPSEEQQNRQSFYDYLCALDFL